MVKSREVKIALLGCGKLGQGLFKLWKEKRLKIKEQTEIDLDISHILVKHKNLKRDSAISDDIITDNINEDFNNHNLIRIISFISFL